MLGRGLSLSVRVGAVVNQALAPLGVRLIREPKPLSARVGGEGAGGGEAGGSFFPHTPHRGRWPIPADLSGRREAWAVELCRLYGRPASWPASIAPEVGLLIHALVVNMRPRTVIETGTCLGASTMWIAAALAASTGGVVHTFDTFEDPEDARLRRAPLFRDRLKKVRGRFRRAGLSDHIRVHVGPSGPGVRGMHGAFLAGGGVQLAFIDADHTARGVAEDLAAVEPVLRLGGYLMLHDVFPEACSHTGPREILSRLSEFASGRYQCCDLYTAPANYGLSLLRRIG